MKKFPQTIVPPLPRYNSKRKYTPKQLIKREIYYQRFLTMVLKSFVLRSSEFLVEFLKESNSETFMLKALAAQQEEGPRKITEISTLGGDIDVQARKTSKAFCENFGPFIDTYAEINSFIAEKCKVIQGKAHDLADEYFAVASEI
jgi:hypothetical protein